MSITNILAIETSCDETAVSIVSYNAQDRRLCIRAHVVESQNESHAPFGGVVPELAARDHLAKIDVIARQALAEAELSIQDINSICVTLGPGLIGALMVGVLYARGVAIARQIPLIGVNHVRAHLAPCFLLPENFKLNQHIKTWLPIQNINYPVLALTVSGGHCHLSLLNSPTEHHILGRTLDDACGEAFDKVAKMLNLGYPGGAVLEKLAQGADPEMVKKFHFPQPFVSKGPEHNRYNFSYSGLKTACLMFVKKHLEANSPSAFDSLSSRGLTAGSTSDTAIKAALASAFQNAALLQLKTRVLNALDDHPEIKTIFVAGGVAQNKKFRELFADLPHRTIFAPTELCSDNATMIALQSILDDQIDALQMHPFSRYPY